MIFKFSREELDVGGIYKDGLSRDKDINDFDDFKYLNGIDDEMDVNEFMECGKEGSGMAVFSESVKRRRIEEDEGEVISSKNIKNNV